MPRRDQFELVRHPIDRLISHIAYHRLEEEVVIDLLEGDKRWASKEEMWEHCEPDRNHRGHRYERNISSVERMSQKCLWNTASSLNNFYTRFLNGWEDGWLGPRSAVEKQAMLDNAKRVLLEFDLVLPLKALGEKAGNSWFRRYLGWTNFTIHPSSQNKPAWLKRPAFKQYLEGFNQLDLELWRFSEVLFNRQMKDYLPPDEVV